MHTRGGPRTPAIITDSCCDLPRSVLDSLGVETLFLHVTFGEETHPDDLGVSMTHQEFYSRVRGGEMPKTAAVNLGDYVTAFKRHAQAGRPVLVLGLSTALSGTMETAAVARSMVLEAFPGADIRLVPSINASASQGLWVVEAARKVSEGMEIDELERWATDISTNINCHFLVESLEHLRRGGRISNAQAVTGTMLGIRPILRIDAAGRLVPNGRARGRVKAMRTLVNTTARLVTEPDQQTVYIAHADAQEDAETLRDMLLESIPFTGAFVTRIGPVIGSHVGPGMLEVVFLGAGREE